MLLLHFYLFIFPKILVLLVYYRERGMIFTPLINQQIYDIKLLNEVVIIEIVQTKLTA